MSSLTKVELKIFGQDYIIAGEASEEYIRSLGLFVNSKMEELSKVFPNANPVKLAVLAAVNIADELFQMKEVPMNAEVVSMYEEKTKMLISMLDKGLIGE